MQGLLNRSLEEFLREAYGPELWNAVADDLAADPDRFDPVGDAAEGLFERVALSARRRLDVPLPTLLEEYGLYLQSAPRIRSLVRLCACGFGELVELLPEMPDRARLALPSLPLPGIEVTAGEEAEYRITTSGSPMYAHILTGFLRGVSDDFGALSLVVAGDNGTLSVRLLDAGRAGAPQRDPAPVTTSRGAA